MGEILDAIIKMDDRAAAAGVAGQWAEEERARLPLSDIFDYDEMVEIKHSAEAEAWVFWVLSAAAEMTGLQDALMSFYFNGVAVGVLLERARHEKKVENNGRAD